jgi:hypothetical protein
MEWTRVTMTVALAGSAGCASQPRGDDPFASGGTQIDPSDTGSDPSAPATGSSDPTTQPTTEASADASADGGIKLDVGADEDTEGADDGPEAGCEKVDFLFVIDNSGSMQDEQQNLVASFPGFIGTIQDVLMAQDYHIMVVDTDAESLSFSSLSCTNNVCTCEPEPQCCFALCANEGPIQFSPPPTECAGMSCDAFELPTGCPVTLGAGKAEDPLGADCGIDGGLRYMTDTQPDLVGTFECAAVVGAGGDGNERPMEAMSEAVTTQTQTDGCHEGFLRDDAILVVTFITDEEDAGSMGTPASWKQTLVDAKNGNEQAIVVLGLVADTGVAGAVCTEDQAEDAPLLRQFAESFTRGQWGSVCSPSYNAFFDAAVSVIDTTCDEFVPEG